VEPLSRWARCQHESKEQSMHKEEGRTVENPVESRQGFLDRPVLVVLAVSIALLVVLYALIYFGYFGAA
jgi:hypothetical protein